MFQIYKLGKIEKQTAPQYYTAQWLSDEWYYCRVLSTESKVRKLCQLRFHSGSQRVCQDSFGNGLPIVRTFTPERFFHGQVLPVLVKVKPIKKLLTVEGLTTPYPFRVPSDPLQGGGLQYGFCLEPHNTRLTYYIKPTFIMYFLKKVLAKEMMHFHSVFNYFGN